MSAPWQLTVWVVTQEGRPFDYRFSRAAAFGRAKELRKDVPSGNWGVEERQAFLSLDNPRDRHDGVLIEEDDHLVRYGDSAAKQRRSSGLKVTT